MASFSVFPSARATGSVAASTTVYWAVANTFLGAANQTTEARVAMPIRTPGILSNLFVKVTSNDRGASTYTFRKNTANGNMTLSIGASTTGNFQDTTNTDSVVSGDLINTALVTGAGGTSFIIIPSSVVFRPTAENKVITKLAAASQAAMSTAGTTYYNQVCGQSGTGTTETSLPTPIKIPGTFRNMALFVSSNTRLDTTTTRSRKNSANGNMIISVATLATGVFEDTTNSDTVAIGDTINYSTTLGALAGTFTLSYICSEFECTEKKFEVLSTNSLNVSSAATVYCGFGVNLSFTSESDPETRCLIPGILKNYRVVIAANTLTGTVTNTIRKNLASTALTISIGAGQTGTFEDTIHNVSVVATDTFDELISAASGGTNVTYRSRGISFFNVPSSGIYFGAGM